MKNDKTNNTEADRRSEERRRIENESAPVKTDSEEL